MSSFNEVHVKLPRRTVFVKESRVFSYPTRLAAAWQPEILEIVTPETRIERPEIEIRTEFKQSDLPNKIVSPSNLKGKIKQIYHAVKSLLPSTSNPVTRLEREILYDARWDTDKNISHVLHNQAPQPLAARSAFPQITVILRAQASQMAVKSYQLLGFDVICTDGSVMGHHLVGPQAISGIYEAHYRDIYGTLTFEGRRSDTPERIFISRRKTRALINEDEIEQLLNKYGFKKYYYEDIPLSEQWSLTRNASAVVGCHGAALSTLSFNVKGVKVIELFHPGYVNHAFRNTTFSVGGEWCAVTGQIPENLIQELDIRQKPRAFALANMRIDPDSLRRALDYLFF